MTAPEPPELVATLAPIEEVLPAPDYARLVGGRVGRSVSWLLAARLVSILTSLLTATVLGRLLNPTDFGVQAILNIALLLAAALSDGTFAVPLMQRAEVTPSTVSSALWLSVLGGGLCMGALLLAGPEIGRISHAPGIGLPLVLTALILPLRGVSSVGVAMLERRRDYRGISGVSMLGSVLATVMGVAMAVMGYGLWSLVIPNLLEVVLEAGLNTWRARLPMATAPSREGVSQLFHAGAATTVNQILNWAGLNAPSLIASSLLGPFRLGLYSRAATLQNTALQVSGGPMGRVLIPTFASLQGQRERLRDTFKRFMGAVLPLNALITAEAVVHAEAIVRLLLGRKWFAAVPVVQFLFLGFLPRSAYKVTEALSLGSGRFGASAVRQGLYFAAVCAGAAVGGRWGLSGLTLGVALGLWSFYALSLAQAESLSGVGWGWLALAHARALLLALLVAVPDWAATAAVHHLRHPANPGSFKALVLLLAAHGAGAATGLLVLAGIVVLAGETLVGPLATEARGRAAGLFARLRSGRLTPRPRAPG